jgi:hypothetical protein
LVALRQIPAVDQDSITDRQSDEVNNFTNWTFLQRTGDSGGRVYYEDEVAVFIHIYPGSSLTLEAAVDGLGEPDQVLSVSGCADTRYLYSSLLYLDTGVYVAASLSDRWQWSDQTSIARDRRVGEVAYFEPGSDRELLTGHVPGAWPGLTYAEVTEASVPWQGFGSAIPVVDACD